MLFGLSVTNKFREYTFQDFDDIIKSTEHSSSGADSRSSFQEINSFLWILKADYLIDSSRQWALS